MIKSSAFSTVLKRLRKQLGISQEVLAHDCGLDRTYISLLERGARSPSLITLTRIAKSLQLQPSELLQLIERENTPQLGQSNVIEIEHEPLNAETQRLSEIIHAGRIIVYACEPNENFHLTFISQNIKAQLGYDKDQVLAEPTFWHDHIHPADWHKVEHRFHQLLSDEYLTSEYRLQAASEEWRLIKDESMLIKDESGKPKEIIGFLSDVSDIHR